MKKLAVSLLLAIVSMNFTGCGTLGKPDPAVVQFVARDVAFIEAQAAMTYNPSFRVELELARQALQGFVAAGSGNVTNLQAILQQHIPTTFSGGPTNANQSGLIVGNGGILLYNAAGALVAKIDKNQVVSTYAQPIALGLLQGLSQALGVPMSRNDDQRQVYCATQCRDWCRDSIVNRIVATP